MRHLLPMHDAFVELVSDPALVCDHRGIILCVNKSMAELFGYTVEELRYQNVDILVPEDVRDKHAQLRAKYYENPHKREFGDLLKLRGTKKDGTEIALDIMLFPTNYANCVYMKDVLHLDPAAIENIKVIVLVASADEDPNIAKLKELLNRAEEARQAALKNS